jgi:hypothetical protein
MPVDRGEAEVLDEDTLANGMGETHDQSDNVALENPLAVSAAAKVPRSRKMKQIVDGAAPASAAQ